MREVWAALEAEQQAQRGLISPEVLRNTDNEAIQALYEHLFPKAVSEAEVRQALDRLSR